MPSGPEQFVSEPSYRDEFSHARELLFGHPGRWRIIYHYDGDGVAAASSLVRALDRLQYRFHATPLTAVERDRLEGILKATRGPVFIVDTGAAWPEALAAHPHPVILLDHHRYPGCPTPPALPKHVAWVNPLDWGVDGMSEMCGGTLAWLFTVFLDPRNWDNVPWGLSGAIADRQHVGGLKGLNSRLVAEARERRFVEEGHRLALFGTTLEEALVHSIDPYYVGLSGDPTAVREFLEGLRLRPSAPPSELSSEEGRRLAERLGQRLREQGARPEFCALVERPSWRFPSLEVEGEELSNLQNATGREGIPGVGVALALGDPAAFGRAREAEVGWRKGILTGLGRVERDGVRQRTALQWFESPEVTLAGTQAGLAMNYIVDPRKPTLVFSAGADSIKVSGRGTPWLVEQGLDLSSAIRAAAAHVGGEGGGHPVASGATIPPPSRDAFLAEVDRLVALQIPRLVEEVAA